MGTCKKGLLLSVLLTSLLFIGNWAGSQESGSNVGGAAQPNAPRYSSDHILVKFKKGFPSHMQQTHHLSKGAVKSRKLHAGGGNRKGKSQSHDIDRIDVVTIPEGADVQSWVKKYQADPDVEYAEPDYLTTVDSLIMTTTPNDPRFSEQWALTKIQAPQAWDYTTGSPSVAVAVIDTGVDYNHPDLAANVWTNPGEIAGNGIDDDGNGYIDDIRGWDWVNNDNNPIDDNGHGTHKAGIISAVGNNGIGVAGVTWICKIMALKTSDASGSGSSSNHASAIIYAANMGARVSNNSYNGGGTSQVVADAIRYAESVGHVTVVIAGNQSADVSSYYPSNVPEAVTVAGSDSGDLKMGMSNYGSLVDVTAPGVNILSAAMNNSYASATGTSDAAPHAAGILALLTAQNPNRTNAQLVELLKYSCDDIDSLNAGYEGKLGNGRVNAYNAVRGLLKPKPELVGYVIDDSSGNGNGYPDRGETVTMTVTLRNTGANATDLSGTISTTDAYTTINGATATFGPIVNGQTGNNGNTPFSFTVATNTPADQTITFALNLTGNGGSYAGLVNVKVNVGPNLAYAAVGFDDAGSNGVVPGAAEPGETVNMIVTLKNSWGAATNVAGTLTTTSPYVTIQTAAGTWGTIGNNAEVGNSAVPFRVTFAQGTPLGTVIPFTINVSADAYYVKSVTFNYLMGWSIDKSTNVPVCTAGGNQGSPNSVADGSGGTIIAWSDYRNGNSDIYAQRIDASGYVRWTRNGVALCTAAGDQTFLYYGTKIVADGFGGALIAWTDGRNGVFSTDIYAQRIDANGNILWQTDGVPVCTASNYQQEVVIAGDGSGGAVIAWSDFRSGSNNDIYMQRVGADGSMQWANDGILVAAGDNPRLVGDTAGGGILCWRSSNSLYAQRISTGGTSQWASGGIYLGTSASGFYLTPNMMSDGSGGAIVAWSNKNVLYNSTDSAYVQKISSGGLLQWASGGVMVVSQINFNQSEPQLATDGAGGVIVVWDRYTSGNTDVYAQRVSSTGTIQWTAGGAVVSNASYGQSSPRAVSDGSGGVVVAWTDSRNNVGYWTDIFAMRLTSAGTASPGWTANGVSVSTGNYNQLWPIIVGDGTGGAVIAWTDYRDTAYGTIANSDIYAHRISSVGLVGKQLSKLANISTRAYVGTGTNVENGGFIISGAEPKTVIIRAKGPSLVDAGLTGVLANPYLKLYSFSAGAYVAQNDNWQTNDPLQLSPIIWKGTVADIQATGLQPSGTNSVYEAALLVTLPAGAYSAIVSGVNNGVGTGMVSVNEVSAYPSSARLINISTRAYVGTGTNVENGGFIISGTEPKTVIIRAKGPSLVDAGLTGVLANPYLKLYSFSAGAYVAQNDNWQTNDPLQLSPVIWKGTAADIQATGLQPSGTNSVYEAALLVTLPPGAYSAIVSGVSNGVGTGMISVNER